MKFTFLVFLATLFNWKKANTLKCYQCEAQSEQECLNRERPAQCKEYQDACIQMRFSYYAYKEDSTNKNGTKVVQHMYSKRCIASVHGDCKLYCKKEKRKKNFDCKERCCTNHDFCNNVYIEGRGLNHGNSATNTKSFGNLIWLPLFNFSFFLIIEIIEMMLDKIGVLGI